MTEVTSTGKRYLQLVKGTISERERRTRRNAKVTEYLMHRNTTVELEAKNFYRRDIVCLGSDMVFIPNPDYFFFM